MIASEAKTSPILGELLRAEIKKIVKEALREETTMTVDNRNFTDLITPEELADRLKVPTSWVYEQSRQGKIPTHRVGRYIRFELGEVLESQQNKPVAGAVDRDCSHVRYGVGEGRK
jgi:excisionase family DNA binding protein